MKREASHPGHAELDNGVFDEIYDVIVVGYGFAGGIAAIEAGRNGAKVLMCEKMPQPGGISICLRRRRSMRDQCGRRFFLFESDECGDYAGRRPEGPRRRHGVRRVLREIAYLICAGRDLEADGGQKRRQLPFSRMADVLFRSSAGIFSGRFECHVSECVNQAEFGSAGDVLGDRFEPQAARSRLFEFTLR